MFKQKVLRAETYMETKLQYIDVNQNVGLKYLRNWVDKTVKLMTAFLSHQIFSI